MRQSIKLLESELQIGNRQEVVKKALAHLKDDRLKLCMYRSPVSGDLSEKRLPADVVLAFGGWHGIQTHCVIESYDVKTDRWQLLPMTNAHANRAYLGTVATGTKVILFYYCFPSSSICF